MPVLNWVRFSQVVSWDQASVAAATAGGRLYIDDHDPAATQNWPQSLADVLGQSGHAAGIELNRPAFAWFGISAIAGGGYRWVDGRTVDPAWAAQRFGPAGDPNADANPDNDTAHPVILGNSWVSPQGPNGPFDIRGAFIEYASSRSVQGTPDSDAFFGGGGPGETLRTGAGADSWIGTGGGKVYLGAGDDFASVRTLGFANDWVGDDVVDGTVIFDGPGRDVVDAGTAAVRAEIDGDDDQFIAHRVTYTDATGDLTVTPPPAPPNPGEPYFFLATGAGVGSDRFDAAEVVGGSGNDHLEGVSRMQGGPGDDYLAPDIGHLSYQPYAQGDAGNDTLVATSAFRTQLRGGAGDDVLLLSGPAEVSGGAGSDLFAFRAAVPVTIVDFGPGDLLDLSRPTDRSAAELFGGGFLKVANANGYTQVLFDPDGGGDGFSPLITLKGVFSQAVLQDRIIGGSPDDPEITQAYFTAPIPAFQAIRIVSTDAAGAQANAYSLNPQVSDDGRTVTFESAASNLVPGDVNDAIDTFQKDLATGAITRIAENTGGFDPVVPNTTPDGRYAFQLAAIGPDLGDFRVADELVRVDATTGEVVIVSASANGTLANSRNVPEFLGASDDGRYVLFYSNADSLVPDDINYVSTDTGSPVRDYFVKDLVTGSIVNVSTDAAGNQIPLGGDPGGSRTADISADGRYVVFTSGATALVPEDANGADDIFWVDLQALRAGTGSAIAHVDIDNPGGSALTISIPKTPAYYAAQTTTPAGATVAADLSVQLLDGQSTSLHLDVTGAGGEDAGAVLSILSTVAESAPVRVYEEAHGRDLNGESLDPQISSDGRYVVFTAQLAPSQGTFNHEQVLRLDLTTGETTVVSTGPEGAGNSDSFNPRISSDGRFVEFISRADNLPYDPNATPSDQPQGFFYRKDLATGDITQVSGYSLAETGQTANGVQVTFTTSRFIDENRSNDHVQTQDLFVSHPDEIHSLTGGAANELLQGGQFRDHLSGGGGRDLLRGGPGADTLAGEGGDDQLEGGAGGDVLDGGPGADLFVFAEVTDGADTIGGFTPGQDRLVFAAQMFGGGLTPGEALVTAPQTGNLLVAASDPFAASLNSSAAFLYDTDDGRLWFDPDGSGARNAVLMATLASAPVLGSSDFLFA